MRTRIITTTTGLVTALAALLALAGCTAPEEGQPVAATSTVHEAPRPQDQNLLAWTGDPNDAGHVTAQSAARVGGRITLVRIVLREQIAWSNIWLGLAGLDPKAQLTKCFLGVYDAKGILVASTRDISPQLMTEPVAKPLSFGKPFTAAPGTYFIALLLNGNWDTNALTLKSTGAGISVNAGLTPPNLRYSSLLEGQSSLPARVNLAEQSTSTINTGWGSQWYGIS